MLSILRFYTAWVVSGRPTFFSLALLVPENASTLHYPLSFAPDTRVASRPNRLLSFDHRSHR